MMRTSLLHTLREPRRRHGDKRGRRSAGAVESFRRAQAERATHRSGPGPRAAQPAEQAQHLQRPTVDAAVERVRGAGGPTDEASYSCECGYRFSAAVSTTVRCPHCGAGQAW